MACVHTRVRWWYADIRFLFTGSRRAASDADGCGYWWGAQPQLNTSKTELYYGATRVDDNNFHIHTWPASTWRQLQTFWNTTEDIYVSTRPRRLVTLYISALEILLFTYLRQHGSTATSRMPTPYVVCESTLTVTFPRGRTFQGPCGRALNSTQTDPQYASACSAADAVVVLSLVFSRLDYCNATIADSPPNVTSRLQSVLNASARLLFSLRKHDHVTPLIKELTGSRWISWTSTNSLCWSTAEYKVCCHCTSPTVSTVSQTSTHDGIYASTSSQALVIPSTRRYDMIEEFNIDLKAEYTALSSTRSQKKRNENKQTPVPL